MKYISIFLCLSIFLFSCKEESKTIVVEKEETKDQQYLFVNPSVYLDGEDVHFEHISFLEDFFKKGWKENMTEEFLLNAQDVQNGIEEMYWEMVDYPYFKPNLLALIKISETKSIAKVGFMMQEESGFSSLYAIYNFMIHKTDAGYKLSNVFEYKKQDWKTYSYKGNTHYIAPNRNFNLENIKRMQEFNVELSEYFETDILQYKFYNAVNMEELLGLRGFDFSSSMYYNNGLGAFAFPRYTMLFSANGLDYNMHELVHLYTYHLFPDKHRLMDEALAVYLGGALNSTYEEYTPALSAYLLENEIDLFAYALAEFDTNITILKKPIGDLVLAFLCEYTEKEYGKEKLFDLMNSGRTKEDLLFSLKEILGLTPESFDEIIKRKLKVYF